MPDCEFAPSAAAASGPSSRAQRPSRAASAVSTSPDLPRRRWLRLATGLSQRTASRAPQPAAGSPEVPGGRAAALPRPRRSVAHPGPGAGPGGPGVRPGLAHSGGEVGPDRAPAADKSGIPAGARAPGWAARDDRGPGSSPAPYGAPWPEPDPDPEPGPESGPERGPGAGMAGARALRERPRWRRRGIRGSSRVSLGFLPRMSYRRRTSESPHSRFACPSS